MTTSHTPGPWVAASRANKFIDILHHDNKPGAITMALCRVQARDSWVAESQANARLIAAAPDLLAEIEAQYTELADFSNNWPNRHTQQGQAKLCRLRDLICAVTGRDAEDVQNDYCTRAAIAKATQSP